MSRRGGRRHSRRVRLATVAAACALVAAGPVVPGGVLLDDAAAAPPPWPIDPSDDSVSAQWGAGAGRSTDGGPLHLGLDAITPQNPDVNGTLSMRVTVSNRSGSAVDNVVIRVQRAEALAGAGQARTALAVPEGSYDVATSFRDGFRLGAGETRTITLSVPLAEAAPEGLAVTEPGVYPILVNANGRPGDDIDQFLAETRTLVPVDAAPDADPGDGDAGAGSAGDGTADAGMNADSDAPPADPAPVSVIWPLAADVPLVPGETGDAPGRPELILRDESLSGELASDGRLTGLLTALESELAGPNGPGLRTSTCVAVDPELLDVVDRMRDGYRVGSARPSPVENTTRLRDSWGRGDDLDLRDGQGAGAAGQWLDRLETLTRDMCVVTLPWSGAELNAVAATGDAELAAEALNPGDGVVERVLGRPPLDSVVIPPEGYVDAGSVPVLAAPGTTALVAANSLTPAGDDGRLARAGDTVDLAPGARAFGLPVPLSAALAATGAAPEVAGYSSVDGRHDLRADSGVARMQTAVGTLRREIADATYAAGDRGAAPIVAMPPAGWSATGEQARTFLRAVAATFDDGIAEPAGLGDVLADSSQSRFAGPARTASPNPDPGAVSGTEISRARQQSGYLTDLTDMMANDPQVALTRQGFTRPLRRDVLRALSGTGRRVRDDHLAVTDRAAATMAGMGAMLQQLRDSVTLVAPGGVYTRATEASPVVIVGRNGLPLPVPAYVRVQSGHAETSGRIEAVLPAKGSLTLQVNPAIAGPAPDDDVRDRLHLWLETTDGQRISPPVEIVSRTGPSTRTLIVGSIVLTAAIGAFALWRSGRFEGFGRIRQQWGRD